MVLGNWKWSQHSKPQTSLEVWNHCHTPRHSASEGPAISINTFHFCLLSFLILGDWRWHQNFLPAFTVIYGFTQRGGVFFFFQYVGVPEILCNYDRNFWFRWYFSQNIFRGHLYLSIYFSFKGELSAAHNWTDWTELEYNIGNRQSTEGFVWFSFFHY